MTSVSRPVDASVRRMSMAAYSHGTAMALVTKPSNIQADVYLHCTG